MPFALDGVRVLAVEGGASGPFCSRLLGDLGADVVKVERPGMGDVNRHWDTVVHGESAAHAWLDRNKRSLELDLKSEAGRDLFLDLAERADVVTQNAAPGAVDRLGIGYDAVSEVNPEIVYLHISGYGRSGPYSDRKAYDMIMQGETGLMAMNGVPEAMAKIPLSICDINAAMYGALGVMTALFHRERTGEGQQLDVTMFGGVLSWLGYFPFKYWYNDEIPERVGTRHHLLTPYGPFEAADGERVILAVLSAAHWETFCRDVLELPELETDPRFVDNESRVANRVALEARIDEAFAERPREEWTARLDAAGIPWGDVNAIDEALAHPQADHLDAVREIPYRDGSLKFVDHPVDFGKVDTRREPMPDLGEHTESVLREVGLGDEEIRRLHEAGVVSADGE
jgi:crotonobetainyl-CoA:carnitine CoA-transferase CaiB-like acyl-CoA transferase